MAKTGTLLLILTVIIGIALILLSLPEKQKNVAETGDTISVHYIGKLEDGTQFESSYDTGTPYTFELGAGKVIKGWDEGIVGMTVGEKKTLTIPPEKAYGEAGSPPTIPANATLIFEVELVDIIEE
ncbi:FKBP-type peptidyl-prolyl cis-trans isomerase [Candidatus Dojkabacteria bacterium]|nr:FKBP-type peptidyl-prolyl cis-trans isomerase [Candidatus Dojkabacteria bacterium]